MHVNHSERDKDREKDRGTDRENDRERERESARKGGREGGRERERETEDTHIVGVLYAVGMGFLVSRQRESQNTHTMRETEKETEHAYN